MKSRKRATRRGPKSPSFPLRSPSPSPLLPPSLSPSFAYSLPEVRVLLFNFKGGREREREREREVNEQHAKSDEGKPTFCVSGIPNPLCTVHCQNPITVQYPAYPIYPSLAAADPTGWPPSGKDLNLAFPCPRVRKTSQTGWLIIFFPSFFFFFLF